MGQILIGSADRVREAYRYCEWITAHHYENFPVASWLLPRAKRPHVAAIYAFARSADDFSDEGKYQGRGLELLQGWRQALRICGQETDGVRPQHPIFLALADTIRQCGLPVQLLDDLLTAFTMDVTKRRYENWEELITYCRYSANPVGRLVLTIFGIQDPELHRLSDCICTGLQLANHWQDLRIDLLEKDRLYIPLELLKKHGMSEEQLREWGRSRPSTGPALSLSKGSGRTEGDAFPRCRALMAELVKRARERFDQGEPLIARVSGPLRLELRLTLLGGRAILDRIEAADYDPFQHRPILSTWTKLRLLTHAVVS